MTEPQNPLIPALADRYRIERELGRGGMAVVYRAWDLKHDRPVALKVLPPELAEAIGTDRFEREIRFAARLQHPHICPVHDSGEAAGRLWFTMPYIEGESLDVRLARVGRLPVEEALRITREAAQALAAAHEQGIVHRDIKPANLLLTRDGSTLVADFGIARPLGGSTESGERTLTQSGFAPGTPAYMSPEQAAGATNLDGRSDIFSLGLVLYEMLTGERPFGVGSLAGVARMMTDAVPAVSLRRPEVPAAVDGVLKQALALDPAERFPTMADFGAAVEAVRSASPTGVPRRARRGVAWGIIAGLIIALLGWLAWPTAPAHAPAPIRIAVLPLADQSPTRDQAYFSDGLTEELTTALSRLPQLKVVARTSAFQFRGDRVDVREAGRRLGAGALLTGTVRKSGQRLRVSVQLIDAGKGEELWSDFYDRTLADVFQVQEEVARAVAAALRLQLAGPTDTALASRPTGSLEAYDLYLKGRFAWNQRTEASLPQAARYFEQAVERDSGFAQAWAGVADATLLLPIYTSVSPTTAWPRARQAALRAIALRSDLAEAHTSLAYGTMLYEWDWRAAEQSFRRAIAADPEYPTAHHWYADYLAGRGRLEESLGEMRQARDLDPLSRIIGAELAWVLYLMHQSDEADSAISQVLRLDPTFSHGHLVLGLIRLEQGRPAEAVTALTRSLELGGFSAHTTGALIWAQAARGDRAAAAALLDSLTARSAREYVPPFAFAVGYVGLGDRDRAFTWLERGLTERDVLLPENFFEPLFDPLKGDPRYRTVTARLGAR